MELEGYHGGDSASLIPGERRAVGSEPPKESSWGYSSIVTCWLWVLELELELAWSWAHIQAGA